MKKENTFSRKLKHKVILGNKVITEVFFDLNHINFGWNRDARDYNKGPARQNFTEEDVIELFEQLNFLDQKPLSQKVMLKTVDKRYVFNVYDNNKKMKMVVDILRNDATVIVTIY